MGYITTTAGRGVLPGLVSSMHPCGDNSPLPLVIFNVMSQLATDDVNGTLFVTDIGARSARRVDAATRVVTRVMGTTQQTMAAASTADGKLGEATYIFMPMGVAHDSASDTLYVADATDGCIRTINGTSGGGRTRTVVGACNRVAGAVALQEGVAARAARITPGGGPLRLAWDAPAPRSTGGRVTGARGCG